MTGNAVKRPAPKITRVADHVCWPERTIAVSGKEERARWTFCSMERPSETTRSTATWFQHPEYPCGGGTFFADPLGLDCRSETILAPSLEKGGGA
jgi:hypothetical protein